MAAGSSTSDLTAPSDPARVNSRVARDNPAGERLAASELEVSHPPRESHPALGERPPGDVGQAGVVDGDLLVPSSRAIRPAPAAFARRAPPDRAGPDAAHHQPAIDGDGTAPAASWR